MIIRLMELNGSVKATIPLKDIKHVETRTLNYFGERSHNLYLYVGEGSDEYFTLITYLCPSNMEVERLKLEDLIRLPGGTAVEDVVFELHPDAAPATGLATGVSH